MVNNMNLPQIIEKAKYDADNLITVLTKPKEIDLEIGYVITEDNQEYVLTEYSREKILDRLGIAGIINSLESRFTHSEERERQEKSIVDFAIGQQKYPMQLIFDQNNGILRSAVGRRYHRVTNRDVLQDAINVYGVDIDPRFSYYNDTHMNVYFNDEDVKSTPLLNDKILYGYRISNSELGTMSLSINNTLTFLRCTNGLIMDQINKGTRIYHTNRDILNLFETSLMRHKTDDSILASIDEWALRPAQYQAKDLNDENIITKLDYLLKRFGITKKTWRADLIGIMQEREEDLNGFKIGDAVNYYGSNVIDNPEETHALLSAAYTIMAVV